MIPLLTLLLTAVPVFGEIPQSNPRTITVNGEAEVRVVPDEVLVTIGIETLNKDLLKSRADNEERLKRILTSAKLNGVEAKYIATDYVGIEPRYEWQNGRNEFVGYTVRRSLVLTLRALAKFDPILTACLEAGANSVQGVQFRTSDLRKHRDQARVLAVKAAFEKATSMAKELNQKIGRPHTILETSDRWWSGYGSAWNTGGRSSSLMQNAVQTTSSASDSTLGTTSPGMLGISAAVQVIFELE